MSDDEYNSDDGVVFQPRIKTKDEAIKRIRKYSPERPERRHSSMYQYLDRTSTSSASEYVTCENTMASKMGSDTADSLGVEELLSSQLSKELSSLDIIEISDDEHESNKKDDHANITDDSLDNTFDDIEMLLMKHGLSPFEKPAKKNDIISSTSKSIEDLSSNSHPISVDDGYADSCESSPQKKCLSPIFGSFFTKPTSTLQTKGCSKSAQKNEVRPRVDHKMPNSIGKALFRYGESKIRPPSVVSTKEMFGKSKDKPGPIVDPTFKMPATPAKSPLRPNLKNIVSPVGIYIKNSPKYMPLLKANNPNHKSFKPSTFTPTKTTLKENKPPPPPPSNLLSMDLPNVLYKPSKSRVETLEEKVKLPGSIKKLVRHDLMTKHETRVCTKVNESIDRRLMESDLSIDTSDLSGLADISVVTHKQPFMFETERH